MTVIEIINLINTFGEAHGQIHDVYFGSNYDENVNSSNQSGYVLWFYLQSTQITETSQTTNFDISVMSNLNNDKNNLSDVFSDSLEICKDLVAYMEFTSNQIAPNGEYYNFDLGDSVSITPFESKMNAIYAGHNLNLGIVQGFDFDKCSIPLT
jgi:hypothetical protein